MAKTVAITVHPAPDGAEFLTVSDAMHQILDWVQALERVETVDSDRQIVWRLTNAHTSSPPFTVEASAYPSDPTASVDMEAQRVTALLTMGVTELLHGERPSWIEPSLGSTLLRALKRNLNGIGRTEIKIDDEEPLNIVPGTARNAISALERDWAEYEHADEDLARVEYGSVECEVHSLTHWYDKRALLVTERLSSERITCVLSDSLAEDLGHHRWFEAWTGRRLLVSGALRFNQSGALRRIDAESAREIEFADVKISDLKGLDVLEGKTVSEHLQLLWGGRRG